MNSNCKKCKEIEPWNWDSQKDGIWTFGSKPVLKMTLDEFFKMIDNKEKEND